MIATNMRSTFLFPLSSSKLFWWVEKSRADDVIITCRITTRSLWLFVRLVSLLVSFEARANIFSSLSTPPPSKATISVCDVISVLMTSHPLSSRRLIDAWNLEWWCACAVHHLSRSTNLTVDGSRGAGESCIAGWWRHNCVM